MRRSIQRRNRLTALSVMLAMAAFIVTLPGWRRFEPTGQAATAPAGITIDFTLAHPQAVAGVQGAPPDQGQSDVDDPGVDLTWNPSYNKLLSAHIGRLGASADASGDLHANLMVNGDELQATASSSGKAKSALGGCNTCSCGASVSNDLQFNFTITQPSQFLFTASITGNGGSGIGSSGALVRFVRGGGGGVDESVRFSRNPNDPAQAKNISKSGNIAPGSYSITLNVAAGTGSTGLETGVTSNLTLSITTGMHEFHWTNPAAGDFLTASNWNPTGVPTFSDTAIFDLTGAPPITVTAAPSTNVASLLNHGMDLELHGSAQVLSSPLGFAVDRGGQLLLNNGATLATASALVGGPSGSPDSTMFVSGAGTQWAQSSGLIIGAGAPGGVVVNNDGSLNSTGSILLGALGRTGPGALRVESGGLVHASTCTVEAGSVLVSGHGGNDSKLEVASDLKVGGDKGQGSMLVEGGGTVHAQNVTVGDAAGNGGDTITISGVDNLGLPSSVSVSGPSPLLKVASGAGTQVEVKDGGFLQVGPSGQAIIGDKFDIGKVFVHGKTAATASTWNTFGNLFIGSELTPSELIVKDGGRVTVPNGRIDVGSLQNELGRVEVSGTGSLLSSDTLVVGSDGGGELLIADGALVQSGTGRVGKGFFSVPAVGSGLVTIAMPFLGFSEWHVTGDCSVGTDEPGTILLQGTTGLPFGSGLAAILRVDGTLTVGPQALIIGNGKLTAGTRVLNGGKISPGLSPGVIVIEGDYQQTADGVLKMEAAGLSDGQFDVLHVTGNTSLGGTLDVRFLNGYLPRTGDVISFLKLDGTVTGGFAQVIFPQLAPGFQFKTEIVNGSYKLTALNDAVLAPTGSLQFSASNYDVTEGCVAVQLTVTRTGNDSDQITVDFAASDSSAQQRTDYAIASGTVTLASGETSKTFPILIADDNYQEPGEQLVVTLSNPTGSATLGGPSMATVTILDNDTAPPTANVIDEAGDFVAQHYHDFLSREPDPGGFAFWTSQINQCGSDQTCVRAKRIDVSNAFYFELEFQQTGSYVYRLYRAAFGNHQPFPNPDNSNQLEANKIPSYAVLMPDRARVPGGLSLPQEQLDLATAFVQRPAFVLKYPASLDGSSFIDAVLNTIKNDMGADLTAQKPGLLTLFNAGGRGAVMYRLADDNAPTNPINNRAFIDAEYNRAFVATQYFGYLRRDADIGGFLFWLGQVNSAPLRSLSRQHAMVCSFITAAEYQNRFSSIVSHNNGECSGQ